MPKECGNALHDEDRQRDALELTLNRAIHLRENFVERRASQNDFLRIGGFVVA